MKKMGGAAICAFSLFLMCSGGENGWGSAGLGAAGGAVASSGGYEYVANREMKKIGRDYKDGKIDPKECEIRKESDTTNVDFEVNGRSWRTLSPGSGAGKTQ